MGKKIIKIFRDAQSLSAYAAAFYSQLAHEAVTARHNFFVALSGGSTPARMYRLLALPPYSEEVPWQKTIYFWGDERCVQPDDPESNYFQALQLLLGPVNVPQENIFRVKGELEPLESARDYIERLKSLATDGATAPVFDLIFLGLGSDGHTASIFPGSPLNDEVPVLAVSGNYQGRPANRVTFTPMLINYARNLVFMATGADKASALVATLAGSADLINYPAQRIMPSNGNIFWLVDEAAAGMLPGHLDQFEMERIA